MHLVTAEAETFIFLLIFEVIRVRHFLVSDMGGGGGGRSRRMTKCDKGKGVQKWRFWE